MTGPDRLKADQVKAPADIVNPRDIELPLELAVDYQDFLSQRSFRSRMDALIELAGGDETYDAVRINAATEYWSYYFLDADNPNRLDMDKLVDHEYETPFVKAISGNQTLAGVLSYALVRTMDHETLEYPCLMISGL